MTLELEATKVKAFEAEAEAYERTLNKVLVEEGLRLKLQTDNMYKELVTIRSRNRTPNGTRNHHACFTSTVSTCPSAPRLTRSRSPANGKASAALHGAVRTKLDAKPQVYSIATDSESDTTAGQAAKPNLSVSNQVFRAAQRGAAAD